MPPLPLLLPLLPPFMNFLGISQNTLENTFGKPNTFGNISKNHILPRSHNSSGTKSLWRLLDSNILLRLLCLNFSLPVTCPISTLCLGPPCNLKKNKKSQEYYYSKRQMPSQVYFFFQKSVSVRKANSFISSIYVKHNAYVKFYVEGIFKRFPKSHIKIKSLGFNE